MSKNWPKIQIPFKQRIKLSFLFCSRHVWPQNQFLKRLEKNTVTQLQRKIKTQKLLSENTSLDQTKVIDVDRVTNISHEDFNQKYVSTHTPVIFEGQALKWTCCEKWNFEYLESHFGQKEMAIVSRKGLMDSSESLPKNESQEFSEKIQISQFAKQVKKGMKKFLRFSPLMESHPELKNDFDHNWLESMHRSFFGASFQTFIGPKGMKTPMHGGESTAFFYIMAHGEKRWDLVPAGYYSILKSNVDGYGYNFSSYSPQKENESDFPGVEKIVRYQCHLKKGDILYVPSWMWHEVHNLTDSWGVSYRFISFKSLLLSKTFLFVRLFLTKPRVWEVIYFSFFKRNLPDRDHHLLTPSLSRK